MSISPNFKEMVINLKYRLNNIVNLVDTKKNFYNNVFFAEKDKETPINLYNIHYKSGGESQESNIFDKNDIDISLFNLDSPNKIFYLPSSEESGGEKKKDKIPTFRQVCDDILDLEVLELKSKEVPFPPYIYPILMFRGKEPLNTMEKMLNFIKSNQRPDKSQILPYEIKIMPILYGKENKYILSFIIKFYTLSDAEIIKSNLMNFYEMKANLCYDKRDLKDSKWYCVIFRRECIKDQHATKFAELLDGIYKDIEGNKKAISSGVKNSNSEKKNKENIVKQLGNIYYCAIKVDNLDQALCLCVKYNGYNDLKVNLHYLTYKAKKNTLPKVLVEKDYGNKQKSDFYKIHKNYKEDYYFSSPAIVENLFHRKSKFLKRKHKRIKDNNNTNSNNK